MKTYQRVKIVIFSAAALIMVPLHSMSQDAQSSHPKVLIVYDTSTSPFLTAMAEDSARALSKIFNQLGRFLPVEQSEIDSARKKLLLNQKTEQSIVDFASACGADMYVSLSFVQYAKTFSADIKIRAIRDEWKYLEKSRRVQSKIPKNIPALISQEIAFFHKNIPIAAKVIDVPEKGYARISAGEWNGISQSALKSNKGIIQIIQTAKYQSLIKTDNLKVGEVFTLYAYPNTSAVIRDLDDIILKNTIKTYAISEKQLKNDNDELRCISTTCVINPGGNFCLGGYGAFLSTHYLGFQNPAPAIDGIIISSFLYASQLLLIPGSSLFQANFFPWVCDTDKTKREQNLHIFLWATIPLTFSAAFFDQLAYQCHRSEVLPPFFQYRDNTAAFLSAIIPGGGFFFKGYRYTGWAYFLSEITLGSYTAYYWDDERNRKYYLIGIAAIKALEIFHAYFIQPSYAFFTSEIATGSIEILLYATPGEHAYNEVCYGIEMKSWF